MVPPIGWLRAGVVAGVLAGLVPGAAAFAHPVADRRPPEAVHGDRADAADAADAAAAAAGPAGWPPGAGQPGPGAPTAGTGADRLDVQRQQVAGGDGETDQDDGERVGAAVRRRAR